MSLSLENNPYRRHLVVIIGLFICISIIYSNSIHNDFQFDDRQILDRPNLHLTNLSATSLKQTLIWTTAEPKLYRPVACLSLGINFYFGQLNPFGYHLVNITIHILCSFAVYCFIYLLLGIPSIRPSWFKQYQYELAVLTCFLFALHPIQTNVATYIIQRMTSLAALFYIISICGFIIFRRSLLPTTDFSLFSRFAGLLIMIVAGMASILSKENSAILPVMIVSMDYLFFYYQSLERHKKISRYIYISFVAGPVFAALLLSPNTLALLLNPQDLINSFSHRDFTLTERLLTEPRIVLYYIYLLFVPRIDLLNLNYDVPISTSLYSPPQTLLAIIFIIALLLLAIKYHRQRNLMSFVILWYFANLVIESTVFPLELVYEHRSYLPGISIFLLIAGGLYYISLKFSSKLLAALFLASILILYGNGTYMRNFVWRTPIIMWQDIVTKSPHLSRAHSNLGKHLLDDKQLQAAEQELRTAIKLNPSAYEAKANLTNLMILYGNRPKEGLALAQELYMQAPKPNVIASLAMGNAYIMLKDYKSAQPYFQEILQVEPFNTGAINNLATCQLHNKDPEKAIKTLESGIQTDPTYFLFTKNLAQFYWQSGKNHDAVAILHSFINQNPNNCREAKFMLKRIQETPYNKTSQ